MHLHLTKQQKCQNRISSGALNQEKSERDSQITCDTGQVTDVLLSIQ